MSWQFHTATSSTSTQPTHRSTRESASTEEAR